MNIAMLQSEAESKKARLKELAGALETRSLTETEEKEVDEGKKHLSDLQTKIERAEYLQTIATRKAPANADERDFAKRSRNFSLSNIIAKAAGKGVDIGSEQEISDELKRQNSLAEGDFIMPFDALETRTIQTNTDSDGANKLKTEDYMGFIEYLRNMLVIARAGATMLRGSSSTIRLPRQTNTTQARWLGESGAASNDDLTFDSIELKPRKLMGLTSWSAQTALESNPSIEQVCRNDLMMVISHEIDRVALYGGGDKGIADTQTAAANEPHGITRVTDALDHSTAGVKLTYANALAMAAGADEANIMQTRRAFICNPKLQYFLMQELKKSSFTVGDYIWANGGIAGMTTHVSNVVKSNNSAAANNSGTTTGSDLFYGQFSDLYCAIFGSGVSLLLNEMGSLYTSGGIQLRSLVFCDVAVRHEGSFSRRRKVLTA